MDVGALGSRAAAGLVGSCGLGSGPGLGVYTNEIGLRRTSPRACVWFARACCQFTQSVQNHSQLQPISQLQPRRRRVERGDTLS